MENKEKKTPRRVFFYYMRLESAPPYWLMMNFASAGFGFLMFTGY